MTIEQAIEHTKNKRGMRVSVSGLARAVSESRGSLDGGRKYAIEEHATHFDQAREAWLNGDLETVAEYFGLYI